jgi:hypothetical protein
MHSRFWLPIVASISFAISISGCMTVRIEPSDKPMVVDLNVKVDHEIRTRVVNDNEDLLNMEENYRKKKPTSKKKGKEDQS